MIASAFSTLQTIGATVAGLIVAAATAWLIALCAIFLAALVGFGGAAPDQEEPES